ncbi:retrotransposon hot spot (RHS) protein [Trypanosoma conorhini]|uniref:Retrotransposon hot spot (RHS) protein n=1 Tax=Trypanosoma conorhini TaxID=83891 RepID=A0A3R7L3I9_9TRYP|nr:retrotransposon hot spot (RHS) protein [Trypanosoma conorhini]RNF20338.1 retrotransposon hot spot (RHS) protein [Trypanosoma conorhini]
MAPRARGGGGVRRGGSPGICGAFAQRPCQSRWEKKKSAPCRRGKMEKVAEKHLLPARAGEKSCDSRDALAQPATSTWCQSLVLSIREEAKRLLLACLVWARSRRIAAGPEGHEMEPCVGLPEERSFFPLPTSIGACQRCVCRL